MDAPIPNKYIRTLESDMATLKSGGNPDLAPLAEATSSPAERLVAPSPVIPIPIPIPPPAAEPLPIPQPIPPPAPTGPAPLETYASDFSDRMKDMHASTATVLAAEQDAAPQEQSTPDASRSNLIYISAGTVLILVSGVGVYFAYAHYFAPIEPIILAPAISVPIFVDDREQISGTGITLLQAIEQSGSRPLVPGAIRLLYITDAATTSNIIFAAIKIPAPDILLRNLNASGSMAGVININGSQDPFFILSVSSYGGSFSGMLSWEPMITRDLGALFPAYPAPVVATSTTATSTTPIFSAGFHDETVSNHDVRVYRDAKNRSVILYGYWNQKTLIIARDSAAFAEIVQRLATSRAQ